VGVGSGRVLWVEGRRAGRRCSGTVIWRLWERSRLDLRFGPEIRDRERMGELLIWTFRSDSGASSRRNVSHGHLLLEVNLYTPNLEKDIARRCRGSLHSRTLLLAATTQRYHHIIYLAYQVVIVDVFASQDIVLLSDQASHELNSSHKPSWQRHTATSTSTSPSHTSMWR